MTRFLAAAVQMRSGTDVAANAEAMEVLVREAAKAGARYVQTPEMTGGLIRDKAMLRASLEPEERDRIVRAARRLSAELKIWLHVGSTAIARPDGKVANRGFLFSPEGRLAASYDKIHMFDVDLNNGESWRESATYEPGRRGLVADIAMADGTMEDGAIGDGNGTRLGFAICYDLRFPQLFRAEALAGAAVMTLPAAFTRQTGEAHWHVLVRARAIENGAWVIAAAQGGLHEDGRETFGHSMIVDPWGRIAAEIGGEEPGVALAEIDTAASDAARAKIPNLRNARDFTVETAASAAPASAEAVA